MSSASFLSCTIQTLSSLSPGVSEISQFEGKMDEELLKRNTDCVYFLASPFTCKKGVECEYRHSETARLNPTDCWYWLSGKCLNPTCGFRHPPVDMHIKAPAKAPLPDKSSFPPNKKNVPCYFYLNRHCNKGDKCPFLHGPKDILASKQKDFEVVDAPSVDDRMPLDSSDQNVTAELSNDKLPTNISKAKLPARIEPVLDQPEIFPSVLKRTVKTAKEDPLLQKKHADISDNLGRKDPSHSYPYEYEEASATMSDSLNSSDQCSKEKVDNGVQVEVWESSPGSGFDDLVEGRSESIGETDDEEDMLSYGDPYDRNDEGHENLFKDHSYKDQKGYGGRFLREKRIHGPVNYSDDEDIFELVGYSDWDKGGNRILSQKRKLINVGLAVGGRYDVDLRDHLARQRIRRSLDGRLERPAEKFAFRSCSLPSLSKERRGRRQRRISTQRLHGRFASSLERRDQAWNSRPNSHRHLRNQKRQKFSSNVQRPLLLRRKRDSDVRTALSFTGPMTLAQIREAKCRTTADSTRQSSRSSSVNFAGPKPLTEILKDKKFRSGGECNTDG